MKRNLNSAISGLLALGGACLLFAVFANAAPPDESVDAYSPNGKKDVQLAWDDDWAGHRHFGRRHGVNFVVGSAFTHWEDPEDSDVYFDFGRTYAVVKTWRGVRGHIFVNYYEQTEVEVFETRYVIKADCLDVEKETGEAWIGGEVVYVTTNFGAPEVGWRIVNYVDDNDGGNPFNPDLHGSAWLLPDTCEDRPEPFFLDESQRGKIVVR